MAVFLKGFAGTSLLHISYHPLVKFELNTHERTKEKRIDTKFFALEIWKLKRNSTTSRGKLFEMANVPFLPLRTHSQRVCSLYKAAIRQIEYYYDQRDAFRYRAVLMRARFDKNAKEPDYRRAVEMLKAGEDELFSTLHPLPKKYPESPGGVAYGRVVTPADWVLDYWHPLEKAQYPEYFKRREERKKQYVEWWEKEYGKPDAKDSAGH